MFFKMICLKEAGRNGLADMLCVSISRPEKKVMHKIK